MSVSSSDDEQPQQAARRDEKLTSRFFFQLLRPIARTPTIHQRARARTASQREPEPLHRGDEGYRDRRPARAAPAAPRAGRAATRSRGRPRRARAAVPGARTWMAISTTRDRADQHAVRLRLPGELGDVDEEIDGEGERQRRDDKVRADPNCLLFPFTLGRQERAVFVGELDHRFRVLRCTVPRSPYWMVSIGAPVFSYSSLVLRMSNTCREVFSRSAKRSGTSRSPRCGSPRSATRTGRRMLGAEHLVHRRRIARVLAELKVVVEHAKDAQLVAERHDARERQRAAVGFAVQHRDLRRVAAAVGHQVELALDRVAEREHADRGWVRQAAHGHVDAALLRLRREVLQP